MNLNRLILAAASIVLLSQCDPTKKMHSGEEYTGAIDTSYTYDYGEYEYADDYDYYTDDSELSDTRNTFSPWSPDVYRASARTYNDLIHTALDVRFDWEKAWLFGQATLTVKPYFEPVSNLVLDAKGMDIKQVALVNGKERKPLMYTYDNLQLNIQLDKSYTRDETYTLFIEYISKPNDLPKGGSAAITSDQGLYFINNDGKDENKPMQIWTQGETEASSCWFPTIDKPNQRTTQEIRITIENNYKTLSNGALVSSTKNADGTRTDYWKMDLPHAPYLFMMAIGEFSVVTDKWNGMEVSYFVEPAYEKYARNIFGNTPEMLTFYSDVLGVKYPWNKYAQVVVRDYVSGAMENTTATLHGEFLQQTDREMLDDNWEDVISHELFHQWFGDLVTTESWSNLPLNESFATYGEYLWREYKYGRTFADEHLQEDYYAYMAESESKQVDMIRFNYEDKEDMFDSHSYAKGGCILHMLRKYVGDDAFFASLKEYLESNKFQAVEIHNLRLAFEKVTGEDLNWFFNQWFLSSGHPDLYVTYEYDEDMGALLMLVEQQQYDPTPLYVLPVDVDIYIDGKAERTRIWIDEQLETFSITASKQPDLVIFDAENQLLANITIDKQLQEYMVQYRTSPLYLDRFKAIEYASGLQFYEADARTLVAEALNDSFEGIRAMALDTISLGVNTTPALRERIIQMAANDPEAYVRAAAVARLTEMDGIDILPILENAINDSSYNVIGTALSALAEIDHDKALEAARRYQHEKSINVLAPVWGILSVEGNPKDNDYFLQMFKDYNGWEIYYVMVYYQQYLQSQSDLYILKKGVDQFKEIAFDDSGNWISFFANSFLSSIYEYFSENMDAQDENTQQSWSAAMEYIIQTTNEINEHYEKMGEDF